MGQTIEVEPVTRPLPTNNPQHMRSSAVHDPAAEVIAAFQAELDDARAKVTRFGELDADEVLAMISGIAGRVAEIRAQLWRINTQSCTALRTREVDPLREDLDLQFKLTSRRIALMEWELRMSGGGI
jgi:hypothetical protein